MEHYWSEDSGSLVDTIYNPINFTKGAVVALMWTNGSSHPIRRLGIIGQVNKISYLCYIDDNWSGLDKYFLEEAYDESYTEPIGQYVIIGY